MLGSEPPGNVAWLFSKRYIKIELQMKKTTKAFLLLLAIVMAICTVLSLLSSCHSAKKATVIEKADTSTSTIDSARIAANGRQTNLGQVSLDLEDFEMWLEQPQPHAVTDKADTAWSGFHENPCLARMLVKAKRASIAKGTASWHQSAIDVTKHRHSSIDAHTNRAANTRTDTVAIAKPPDLSWSIPLLLLAVIAVCSVVVYRKYFN